MALGGREVADAYIEVHGDISKFRRDLRKAARAAKQDGDKAGQNFSKSFSEKARKGMDWDKFLGKAEVGDFKKRYKELADFVSGSNLGPGPDSVKGIEKFQARLRQTAKDAQKTGFMSKKSFDDVMKSIDGLNKKKLNLSEMLDTSAITDFNKRYKKLVDFVQSSDLAPRMSSNKEFEKFRSEMKRTLTEARNFGRVTRDEFDNVQKMLDSMSFKKVHQGFTEMTDGIKTEDFERKFRNLATVVSGIDLGPGHKTQESFDKYKASLSETANKAREMGRINSAEFSRIRSHIDGMVSGLSDTSTEIERANTTTKKTTSSTSLLKKMVNNVRQSWQRMDGTVKLVLFAIVAAAGPAAAALSGLSAAATAIISAAALAAASIVPLGAALAAGGIAAGLAVSSFGEMKKQFPQIKAGIDSIGKAWEKQSQNFGKQWGAALGPLLSDFGKRLGEFDFGTALGKSMAGITKAFQDVVNSTAFTRFGTALTTDLPKAFEGFGTGIAGVFEHLLNLMAAAAPAAKILGDAFAKWGQQLGDSLNQKDKFQETQNFFKTAASMLQSILGLAGSLGSALGTVFGAGAASGKRLIDALKGLTDEWGKWLKSTEGQNALAKWFANGEKIIMSFKPLLVGLGDALNALSTDKAADQFANFAKSIGDALPKVAELLNVIGEADILNILGDALNAALDALKPLLPALGQFAKTLGTTLRGIIQKVGPMLGRIFESFKPAVEALSPAIEALGRFMEPIFPIVESIGTAVGKVASQVFPLLGPAIDKIGTALKPVFEVLQQFGNFIRDVVAPIIGTVLVGAINSVVGFFEGFGRVVQGVIQIVTGIIQGFGQFFTKLFQGDIGGALNALGEGFKMVWDGIINVVSGAVQAIWEFINIMIVGKMVAGVKGALTGIKTLFTNIWNGIKSFMETITNGIKTVVTNVWNGIKSFFGGIMNWFKTTVSNIWNGIKNYFSSVFGAIKGIISTAWNSIKTTTSNIWNGIKTTISNIINGVKSTISNVINSIKSFMSGAWGNIKSATSNAWNAVKTSITNLIKGAYEGVKKWIGNALNTVKELPGKIKDFFAGAGSWLVDAGKNVIQGLINGIGSMGNALVNKAKSIADGFINGVKNFFGIHSPSRVMAALGVFIPQGFGIGIDRGGKYVDAAATHMGDAAIDALANNTAYVNAGVAAAEQFANAFDRNVSLAPVVPPVETGIVGGIAGRAGAFSSNGAVVEKSVNIEAGAVVVESKASNEEIVAQQVVDKIAEAVMI